MPQTIAKTISDKLRLYVDCAETASFGETLATAYSDHMRRQDDLERHGQLITGYIVPWCVADAPVVTLAVFYREKP